jgi:KDO2-lipid IV(A) lauroyltransferase
VITLPLERPSLGPRNWGGWIGVGFLWLLGKLPLSAGLVLSRPLGGLLLKLMGRRVRIAERNIARCFPEWSSEQQRQVLEDSFRSLARTLFETATAWSASKQAIRKLGALEGLENLQSASAKRKGVLLITAHLSCLELGGRIMTLDADAAGIYRPLKSPVLEYYQNLKRLSYGQGMIQKRDMRSAVRFLRQGGNLWYAPDQDFGPKQTLFAPFFGIQTASLLATIRLAKMTECAVVPMFPAFDQASGRYTVKLLPALENFPSSDDLADLTRINAIMEAHIRTVPEQYWWIHRRFKTRPPDEAPFYQ